MTHASLTPLPRATLRVALALAVLAFFAGPPCPARADDEDDPAIEAPRDADAEDAPSRADVDLAPRASLWLSLGAQAVVAERRDDVGAAKDDLRAGLFASLGGRFDELLRAEARPARRVALAAERDDRADDPPPRDPAPDPRALGALARGAVERARAESGAARAAEALDDAARRARLSGLVPELRLRVAQVVDEDQSLAPTEYDPERVTASGGTSLWLEGRATFALDRLVFADDEVALSRLQLDREKASRALEEDVLAAFAAWQRARWLRLRDDTLPEARDKAEIEEAVAAARLDVLTAGWFSRQPLAGPPRARASEDADGEVALRSCFRTASR